MNRDFKSLQNKPLRVTANKVELASERFEFNDELNLGKGLETVSARALAEAMDVFTQLTNGHCTPQLAALVFDATHQFRTLDWYFPITNMLSATELDDFYQLTQAIAHHLNFDLQLIGENRSNLTSQMPASLRHIMAGQLAEVFFYKRNILERFLSNPRHFQLYVTPRAFEQDGGVAGGDYNPSRESMQLVVSRVFEGFSGETAGVCPFLHELGHMLDHFDVSNGKMGLVEGLLPGTSPRDGDAFLSKARKLFIAGKSLELKRYLVLQQGQYKENDPLPIGHPYVFQNDGEFIAGYFEMFFRNPHYFATSNPNLYAAFTELIGYDSRKAWQHDFPHYINQNRGFYLSGKRPGKPGLTVPQDTSLNIYTLEEGMVYLVNKSFTDYYNNPFTAGEKLTYTNRNFSPYQGGHTVFFKERSLYLQEDANRDVVDAFDEYFQIHDISGRVVKSALPPAKKKNKRLEELGNLLGCLIFVGIGIWMVFFNGAPSTTTLIAGWLGIIFFGLGATLSIIAILKPKNK